MNVKCLKKENEHEYLMTKRGRIKPEENTMFDSYIIVQTEPNSLHQVGTKLNEFEGVICETQVLPLKSVIVARIITDNHRRFKNFIREQLLTLEGVKKVQGVLV
jgi:hypothetical protein